EAAARGEGRLARIRLAHRRCKGHAEPAGDQRKPQWLVFCQPPKARPGRERKAEQKQCEDEEREVHAATIRSGVPPGFDAHQRDEARAALKCSMRKPMSEEEIREALKIVEDPEAGMNIVDLGLVYGIVAEPGKVRVEMTMTSPACPVAPYIVDESTAAIHAIVPDDTDIEVEVVWEPPWTPDLMSPEAQAHFGWSG